MATTVSERGPRPEKRAAIMDAARQTFARQGYARSSIETIAGAANVSTRTIYKHFPRGKDELFATVLEASATEVADGFERRVRAGVAAATSLQERLVALGEAIVSQHTQHPEHFAMVRQISQETAHFPAGVLAAWREAGPDRVQAETIAQLTALGLALPDPRRAMQHLMALVLAEIGNQRMDAKPLTSRAREESVRAGVDVFLHGYGRGDSG